MAHLIAFLCAAAGLLLADTALGRPLYACTTLGCSGAFARSSVYASALGYATDATGANALR